MLRKILHKDLHVEPETMARLFTADRYEHLYGNAVGIKTHLDKGETIICDRYLFSSLAYQSLGCDFDTILNLKLISPAGNGYLHRCPPRRVCQPDVQKGIKKNFLMRFLYRNHCAVIILRRLILFQTQR